MISSLFVSVRVCFTAALSMAAPSKRTVGSMVGRPRRRGSPKYIRLCESVFLIPGEMGKKLYRQRVCRVPSTSNVQL